MFVLTYLRICHELRSDEHRGKLRRRCLIGCDATRRVFGGSMAEFKGAKYSGKLTLTDTPVQVPAARLYHVDGTPREVFVPEVVVEQKFSEDAPLNAALRWLD